MGYSNVTLANRALDHLGKEHIASLTEDSTQARKVNDVFAATLHEALEASTWTFARRRKALAGVTNDWSERWGYAYDLPSDSLRAIRLVPEVDLDDNTTALPFQRSDGKLYTNESSAKLEYVFATTSTLEMPPSFLTAVSFLLARNVCMPLTRKQSNWDRMEALWQSKLNTAIMHDAAQEPQFWTQTDGGAYIRERGASAGETPLKAVDGSIYWT